MRAHQNQYLGFFTPRGVAGADLGGPPLGDSVQAAVTHRVHAATHRQGVANNGVPALHAGGHAAGRDAVNLLNLFGTDDQADALTLSQVVLVRRSLLCRQVGILR